MEHEAITQKGDSVLDQPIPFETDGCPSRKAAAAAAVRHTTHRRVAAKDHRKYDALKIILRRHGNCRRRSSVLVATAWGQSKKGGESRLFLRPGCGVLFSAARFAPQSSSVCPCRALAFLARNFCAPDSTDLEHLPYQDNDGSHQLLGDIFDFSARQWLLTGPEAIASFRRCPSLAPPLCICHGRRWRERFQRGAATPSGAEWTCRRTRCLHRRRTRRALIT